MRYRCRDGRKLVHRFPDTDPAGERDDRLDTKTAPSIPKPPRSLKVSNDEANYETVLCVSVSTLWPYARVFLVDLIRFVLFLIDPVGCNGGLVDLNLKPTL
jgi:hypothetical protein